MAVGRRASCWPPRREHAALARYRELVAPGVHGGSLDYPGSPLLALRVLRAVDRAVFFETQRDEAGAPAQGCSMRRRACAWRARDGFAGLRALLPPPERRGCVLIDPPYEERADFTRVHDAIVDALQRFPSRRAAGVAARQAARAISTCGSRQLRGARAARRCWPRCCGCIRRIRAPRSTARRWWW